MRARRRGPGRLWLPLAVAAIVLAVAGVAGYGLSQVVAQMASVPGPRTTLPPPSPTVPPTPQPTPSPAPTPSATPEPSPSGTPVTHTVARGEFLSQIAERYGVTVEAIIEANDILSPDHIEPGQELVIPAPP